MPTSHNISPEIWAHARDVLVFYFLRRFSRSHAEDLAQETLLAMWKREDFVFEKDEEFLRVCFGFASRILLQGYRHSVKHEGSPLDPSMSAPADATAGLRGSEVNVYLNQVLKIGQERLREQDWKILQQGADVDGSGPAQREMSNKSRVQLHRARKKLSQMTGWRAK